MHFLLSSVVAVAGSAVVTGSPLNAPFSKRATGLESAAAALGKYFGSATQLPSDTAYMTVLNNTADFGQVTPENAMKWDATEPSRGSFSYSGGDALIAYASAVGYKARCHTLVWHSQLPSWVSSGGFDNATLISIMTNHITTLMTRWKGKCMHWDVVNEALNEDGSYRTSVFYNTIGEAYIPIAFKAAAAADPDAKLYYNDYNIEYSGSKAAGAAKIAKLIQSYGARIDGVGLQSHFIVGSTPSDIATVMKTYTDLGVDVAITELDIRMPTPATDANLAQQKTDYSTVTKACVNTARCVGMTVWQFTDKYSWVPDTFSGQGAACPWDENMAKKPAYDGILSALGGSTSGTSTTTTQATTTTTSAAASTTTVAKWGQCGGINYTGSTVCASGTTCTYYNDWYSQCI